MSEHFWKQAGGFVSEVQSNNALFLTCIIVEFVDIIKFNYKIQKDAGLTEP